MVVRKSLNCSIKYKRQKVLKISCIQFKILYVLCKLHGNHKAKSYKRQAKEKETEIKAITKETHEIKKEDSQREIKEQRNDKPSKNS